MTNELVTTEQQEDGKIMESVMVNGDLSKLSPAQRVSYYRKVCQSLGLNPLTKPFNYIILNGKMTLYALKDATDQLRKIHEVSIDDVDIKETDTQYIVKVKGHDKTGRSDVELGVVNKTDMQGNTANSQMKAVTKSKRRLTLSLCGLGWLDETEVETIPDARIVAPAEGEVTPLVIDPDNMNQETEVIDPIDPTSPESVKWAALQWKIPADKTREQIKASPLFKNPMPKAEFKRIVLGQPES